MPMPSHESPLQVLLLFSDTGGGHRSAAEALIGMWDAETPGRVRASMVDVFRSYTPFPFNRFGPSYPWIVKRASRAYSAVFYGTDTPRRARAVARACYGYVRPSLLRLLADHPADVLVSVHPLFNHCLAWARQELRLNRPLVTVVTDLWTAHSFWFCPDADRIIVPTEGAYRRARAAGISADRLTVRGLPVARAFTEGLRQPRDRLVLRQALKLAPEGKVVLLVGGGDGMGPVYETARAIEAATANIECPPQLLIVTGRNTALREQLERGSWRIPVRVEGFVRNMPDLMASADLLVTKAGPGTITEGILSGLPVVLFGKVPGQEDGNVDYVVESGVGIWEPNPQRLAEQLRQWLTPGNPTLANLAARTQGLADPEATRLIARDILSLTGIPGRLNERRPATLSDRGSLISLADKELCPSLS